MLYDNVIVQLGCIGVINLFGNYRCMNEDLNYKVTPFFGETYNNTEYE